MTPTPVIPLPIDASLPDVVAAVRAHRVAVVTSPPGSGKTTRLPPALLDAAVDGQVWILEPRRIAARAAARRVAAELGTAVGELVGYVVRDERRISAATRIVFATEGVLVRRICDDPFLDGVGAVLLDEFHERHVDTDLALAMLVEVRETVRDDLAVVVTSATLDPEPVRRFLAPDCPLVAADGGLHPVDILHEPRPDDRPLADRIRAAVGRAFESTAGDVLVFLPGVGEIRRAAERLAEFARQRDVEVVELHGSLPPAAQDRVLQRDPDGRRRVVLATNVAESSLTIDGVRSVVDAGLARVLRHDPARGLDALAIERISRASADQRAGRAGRLGPGLCLRLWTAGEERGLAPTETPEIRRTDLAGPVLTVRAFAKRDPREFGWFEMPDPAALERADRLLAALGAVAADGAPTALGQRILARPLHPRLGRALAAAERLGVVDDVALAAALIAERDPFRPGEAPIDLEERLERFRDAEAARFAPGVCRAVGLEPAAARAVAKLRDRVAGGSRRARGPSAPDALVRALLAGFPDRLVRRDSADGETGAMVGGRGVSWPRDGLDDDATLLLALAVGDVGDRRATRSRVTLALGVPRAVLEDAAGELLRGDDDVELDAEGRAIAVRRLRFLDLVLDEQRGGRAPDPELAAAKLAEAIAADPVAALGEQPELDDFLARLAFLRRAFPEAGLPEVGREHVVAAAQSLCHGRRSLREVRGAKLLPAIRGALPPGVAERVAREAPERVALPTGRDARIDYTSGPEPFLAVRLQELFGQRDTPRIAGGRVPLVLHLLGPNLRPVQITRDLASFWDNVYPSVRAELRRRYPKHAWPEDPWTATPESRPRRRRD